MDEEESNIVNNYINKGNERTTTVNNSSRRMTEDVFIIPNLNHRDPRQHHGNVDSHVTSVDNTVQCTM